MTASPTITLHPAALQAMVMGVGLTIVEGLRMPIGRADSFAVMMVALYMSSDPQAKALFEERLEEYGDFVMEVWHKWYKHTVDENLAGVQASQLDVHGLLRRMEK